KAVLQEESGLVVDAAAPVFGVIGRLVEQKGVDLLTAVAPWLLEKGAQLVVLGSGDPSYEAKWRELAASTKGRLALTLGFDAALAPTGSRGRRFARERCARTTRGPHRRSGISRCTRPHRRRGAPPEDRNARDDHRP